jgi:hypothetical protein
MVPPVYPGVGLLFEICLVAPKDKKPEHTVPTVLSFFLKHAIVPFSVGVFASLKEKFPENYFFEFIQNLKVLENTIFFNLGNLTTRY